MKDKLQLIEKIRVKDLKCFELIDGIHPHARNQHKYNGDGEYIILVKKMISYDTDERYEIGVGV